MDLSRLSDSDLRALSKNNLSDVSDAGLKLLAADEDTPKARKGLGAALSKGTEATVGGLGTGFKGLFNPEEAAKQGLERSKALNEKYEEQVSLDKLKEAYEKRGFTGAGGELLRQIPLAIAEQAPNIATTVGGARIGAGLGSFFGPVGAGIGALGGAVAPSLLQMFGSNIERQAATQEEAGQPIDISRARALGAAIPQAALETAANVIPLGGRMAGKIFGPEVEKLLARGGTKAAEKLAQEKFATTVGKGLATGAIAEIPTEIAQQVLERAQAGLDLTSPDALKEYGETAYQVGLLAPIGAGGRFIDKSGAKTKIAAENKEKEAKLALEQQALKEQELLAKQAEEQQLALQQRQQETGDLFGDAALQTEAKGKKLVEGAVSPLANQPELFQTGVNEKNEPIYGARQTAPDTRTVAEREAEANKPPEITPQEMFKQHESLKSHVDDLQDRMSKAAVSGDIAVLPDLSAQLSNAQKALIESNKRVKQLSPIEETVEVRRSELKGQLRSKTAALKKAGELGDFEAISKITNELKEVQTKLDALPGEDLEAQAERLKTEAATQQGEQLQQQQEDLFAQVAKPEPKKEQANQEILNRYQQGIQDLEDAYAAGAPERTINNLIDELRKTAVEKEASKASIVSGETLEQQTENIERVKKSLEEAKQNYSDIAEPTSAEKRLAAIAANLEKEIPTITDAAVKAEKVQKLKETQDKLKPIYENRADALKTVGVLQDRLATAQTERAQGRPEVAEKDAFTRQEEAKLETIETVREILNGDYLNSRNVDVASSFKSGLETKIQNAGKTYAKAAIDEINAVRAQQKKIKQESLSTDDALKITTAIQDRFDSLVRDPTFFANRTTKLRQDLAVAEQALKSNTSPEIRILINGKISAIKKQIEAASKQQQDNIKTFEDSLERIKAEFFKGAKNVQRSDFDLLSLEKLPKALRIKALEEKIKSIKPGGNAKIEADLKKVEDELDALDKEPPSREIVGKVTALKKAQLDLRTRLGRYVPEAGEQSRKEILDELKAELKKVKDEPDVVEQQEPAKGPALEKTGTYKSTDVKGRKVDTPVYKSTEADTLTVREKEAGVKETEGVNPDQLNLFGEKALEPLAIVRSSFENFRKFLSSKAVFRLREQLNQAQGKTQETKAKQKKTQPNQGKVLQLEALRLKIENIKVKRPPQVYVPTAKDKKRLPAARIKANIERSKKELENYNNNLKSLEEQEKKLAEEIRGSGAEITTLFDDLQAQRAFVEELFKAEENAKNLQDNAAQLFNQRQNLLKTIQNIKGDMRRAYQGISVSADITKTRKALKKEKNIEQINSLNKFLTSLLAKKEDKNDTLSNYRARLKEAESTLKELDEGGPEVRAKVLAEVDSLHARARQLLDANIVEEKALLDRLEKRFEKTKQLSPENQKFVNTLEEERKKTAVTEAAAKDLSAKRLKERKEAEQKRAEELAKLPSIRQEIITTNIKAPGSDVKGTRKQIIKKAAAKTKEEIAEDFKQAAIEAARQMAELKKMQNNSLKLKEVKKIESQLKKDLVAKKEEIQKDITNLSALTKALETTKTPKGKAELQTQLNTLNKNIETKQLGKAVDIIEGNLKLLKSVGSDVERALTVLGNMPARTERKKPLKTGVSKVEKDFEESGALKRYGDEKYVDSGLEKEQYDSMFNDIRNRDVDFRIEDTDTKATPLTKVQVVDVLSKIKMPKGLNVLVLNKVPAELKAQFEAMGHDASKVKGWVSPNGTVFIVAENHTSIPDLNETIAHELIGHLGVEALLGEKGMRSLISKIVDQEGGIIALAKKLGIIPEVYGTYHAAKNQGLSEFEAQSAAVRELLAHTAEKEPNKSMTQKAKDFIKLVVAHVRDGLRRLGVKLDVSTSDVYKIIYKARKNFDSITPGAFVNTDGAIRFRSVPAKATPAFEGVLNSTKGIVAEQKSLKDKILGEASGLIFETKYIDRFAPVQKVFQHMKESLMATQIMYYLRMADQRMAFTSEVASKGPLDLVPAKDGKGFMIESQKGVNLPEMVEALKSANVGNTEATIRVFTQYLLAVRAADPRIGLAKLNFSGKITQKMLDDTMAAVNKDPATKASFEKAAAIYAKYNEGLINFAVKSGAIGKDIADIMLKNKNYVPFYRQKDDGSVMLEIGGAPAIKIGNLADQPYLHELIGGDQPIFDVFTSALQNTSMLTDMALRNIATKNTANALAELGLLESSKIGKDNGIHKATKDSQGPTGPDVIHFKENGINYWARVKSESAGVPSQLLVKGLEGVNTSLPNVVKLMGGFSTTLRKWVTRNPAYNLRQLVRDPLNGVITTGLDTLPIASSLKEVYKMVNGKSEGEAILGSRGILGGQVLTGTAEDMQLMLKSIMSGEKGWDYRMAQLDMLAVKGDAATRVVMYNNYLKQGLSEIEATLATLESMNFSKRGISSSLFMVSTMVPFMNAQIQGLNVLYKAFTGNMPFNEKLQIKNKLVQRASMLFASSIMYAVMMQDDEAYQNANDDEKYSNWFMYTPFSDEPIRIPIPFEVGFLFKAVPEALVNLAFGDDKARDVMKAIGKQAFNAVPNITPQGIKPAVEALFNYSLFTNREIDSDRMMQYEPGERYGERTTELAKLVGGAFNISPNKIEYLIRGYFGSVPIALASMANPILRTGEGGEQPESRGIASSETPIIGTFFQPKDAGGLINRAYKDMEEIEQFRQTYKKMVAENRMGEAEAYLDANADAISMGSMAGRFRRQMGNLTNQERAIRTDPDMTAGQKREALDEIRQIKIETAKMFSSAT